MKKEGLRQFKMDEKKHCAVEVCREDLVTPLFLALLQLNRQYTIDIDARNTQAGPILLLEKEDKILKPIPHWSWLLGDADTP